MLTTDLPTKPSAPITRTDIQTAYASLTAAPNENGMPRQRSTTML